MWLFDFSAFKGLIGKIELVALLKLSSWILVMVEWLFLAVPWGCLRFAIVVFPDHTHLLFLVWCMWKRIISYWYKKHKLQSGVQEKVTFFEVFMTICFFPYLSLHATYQMQWTVGKYSSCKSQIFKIVFSILCIVVLWFLKWDTACDSRQCGILISVDSDKPVQPPFKPRNSKLCSVSSLTFIKYSSD